MYLKADLTFPSYKINHLYLVPPVLLVLFNRSVEDLKFKHTIRSVLSGAAPLGEAEMKKFRKIWPDTSWRQGYGMTETSPAIVQTPPQHGFHGNLSDGRAGVILMGQELLVVNPETSHSVGVGETGELWIRGGNVTQG